MPTSVSLEPGLHVPFTEQVSRDIKSNPTNLPEPIQVELFEKKISDIVDRNPTSGLFRAKREKQRQENLDQAFVTIHKALKIGVNSHSPCKAATERSRRSVSLIEMDTALDAIRGECETLVSDMEGEIFSEPCSIESGIRPNRSQGGGLVALANASLTLSKLIKENRTSGGANPERVERDENFNLLEAYRSGYTLDYLIGIESIEGIDLFERQGSFSTTQENNEINQRNTERTDNINFIVGKIKEKKIITLNKVQGMRTSGIERINAQLNTLTSKTNPQLFNIDNNNLSIVSSCLMKFYFTASDEEKNIISSHLCLRRILALESQTGAAGWSIWAEKKYPQDNILIPPLCVRASVLDSLLKPPRGNKLTPYQSTTKKPKNWEFKEFVLSGSNGDGRVFVAVSTSAKTGDAKNFKGNGNLWVVLIVDPKSHQQTRRGNITSAYEERIRIKFDNWKEFLSSDPFI